MLPSMKTTKEMLEEVQELIEAAKLGSGARFATLTKKIASKGGVRNPRAVAAAIGRKKFGKKRFQKLAKAGR